MARLLSLPITYRDILKAGGKSEREIAAILQDIEAIAQAAPYSRRSEVIRLSGSARPHYSGSGRSFVSGRKGSTMSPRK